MAFVFRTTTGRDSQTLHQVRRVVSSDYAGANEAGSCRAATHLKDTRSV